MEGSSETGVNILVVEKGIIPLQYLVVMLDVWDELTNETCGRHVNVIKCKQRLLHTFGKSEAQSVYVNVNLKVSVELNVGYRYCDHYLILS